MYPSAAAAFEGCPRNLPFCFVIRAFGIPDCLPVEVLLEEVKEALIGVGGGIGIPVR